MKEKTQKSAEEIANSIDMEKMVADQIARQESAHRDSDQEEEEKRKAKTSDSDEQRRLRKKGILKTKV
jgi:hypothetical protein